MKYFLVPFFIVLFESSCASVSNNDLQIVKGIYYLGHETSAFVPCGKSDIYWTDGDTQAMNTIISIHKKIINKEYGNLYIESQGVISNKIVNPDYAGTFIPKKLLDYSSDANRIKTCVPNIDDINK